MKQQLKTMGLTDQQIEDMQNYLGATSIDDLVFLKEEDLVKVGVPVLKARRIVAEFVTPAPQFSSSLPTEIKLVQDKSIYDMSAAELFDVFTDKTKDQDQRETAAEEWDSKAKQRAAVVLVDGKTDKGLSLACLGHVRKNGPVQYWGEDDHQVVTARQSFGAKSLRDPLTAQVLVDGLNTTTLTNWKGISMERLVLANWSRGKGYLDGMNSHQVVAALRFDSLDEFWGRLQVRLNRDCEQNPGLKERIIKALTAPVEEMTQPQALPMDTAQRPPYNFKSYEFQTAFRRALENLTVPELRSLCTEAGVQSAGVTFEKGSTAAAYDIVRVTNRHGDQPMYRLLDVAERRLPGYFPLKY